MIENPSKAFSGQNTNDETWGCVASAALAEGIEKRSAPFVPKADQMLFQEGDKAEQVFFLKDGEVILTIQSFGKVMVNVILAAGSVIGISPVLVQKPYGMSAKASENADIRALGAKELDELMAEDPQFSFEISQILAAETLSVLKMIKDLAT